MRKIIIFSLMLGLQQGLAQSFIDLQSKWVETEETAAPLPLMNSGRFFRSSEVVGDTTIEGLSYLQVITHTDEYELTAAGDTVDVFSYDNLWFLREEGNLFYKLRLESESEKLLFDFNLGLGDTAYVNESYTGIWVVEEIFDTEVNGQQTPTYRLQKEDETDTLFLYQGIGSSTGFYDGLKPPCCEGEPVFSSLLECFGNMQGVHAFNPLVDYCEVEIVGATEEAWIEMEVFPNPTTYALHLRFHSLQYDGAILTIQNTAGQLLHWEVLAIPSGLQQHQVDVSGWPPGVYFLWLRAGDRQVARRFVKTG